MFDKKWIKTQNQYKKSLLYFHHCIQHPDEKIERPLEEKNNKNENEKQKWKLKHTFTHSYRHIHSYIFKHIPLASKNKKEE